MRSLLLAVMALMIVGCATTPPYAGKFQPADEARQAELARDPTVQVLLAIAKARIDAEHDALITGDSSRFDASALSLTSEEAAELDIAGQQAVRRHDGLAACGAGYIAAHTTVTARNAQLEADRATVFAVAFSDLTYRSSVLEAPTTTKESVRHLFTYERDGVDWMLSHDDPETLPRGAPPLTHWWDRFAPPPRHVPESARAMTPPPCIRTFQHSPDSSTS